MSSDVEAFRLNLQGLVDGPELSLQSGETPGQALARVRERLEDIQQAASDQSTLLFLSVLSFLFCGLSS